MHTAILGGTFDPVHMGHIAMARFAIKEFELKRLVVVPNGNPPHKTDLSVTDFEHRYNMAKLAFKDVQGAEVSDYEARKDRFSYSLDTMRYFRSVYGDDTAFIIGADSLLSIHNWYKYETLLGENKFIVFRRIGDADINNLICKYEKDCGADIRVSSMEYVDISSTDIRKALKQGSLPCGVIPADVLDYIEANGLYGG